MTKQFQRSKILGTSISNTFIKPLSHYDIVLMINDCDGRKITSLNLIPQHECQINFIKYHLTGNCPIRACSSMSIYHQANTIPGETIKRINDTNGQEVRRGIRWFLKMPKISGNNEKIKAERQEAEKVALILFDRIDISVAKSLLQEIVLAPLPEYRLEQLRIGDDFWPDKDLNAIAFIQDYLDSFSF